MYIDKHINRQIFKCIYFSLLLPEQIVDAKQFQDLHLFIYANYAWLKINAFATERSQPPRGKLRDVAGKKLGFHDGHAEGLLYTWYGGGGSPQRKTNGHFTCLEQRNIRVA